jgi:hypothetical protein
MKPKTYLFPGMEKNWRADVPVTTKVAWIAVNEAAKAAGISSAFLHTRFAKASQRTCSKPALTSVRFDCCSDPPSSQTRRSICICRVGICRLSPDRWSRSPSRQLTHDEFGRDVTKTMSDRAVHLLRCDGLFAYLVLSESCMILALIVGAFVFSSASNNTNKSKFRATESLQWKGNHRDHKHRSTTERVEFLVTAARRERCHTILQYCF